MKRFLFFICVSLALSNSIYAQKSSNFRNTYVPQYVPLPLETFRESNRIDQAQYDAKLKVCQEETITLYKEASTYPQIADGKHLASVVGPRTCSEAYVIVKQGKVCAVSTSDNNYITEFTISTQINSSKSRIGIADSETGVSEYFYVMFLKEIYK